MKSQANKGLAMIRSKYSRCSMLKQSLYLLAALVLSAQSAAANTTVRVTTSLGNFSIELFDDITPGTVANFLNYVSSGRYNGTVIHRSEPGFVIQGGWLTFNPATRTLNPISTDANIQNEFNVSNTKGTIAMAKVAGDPNSANSQWFVNLADNSSGLDGQNGGFTAFGRVIGDGMTVVDSIAALPRFSISGSPFPLINYVNLLPVVSSNFVNITVTVVEETVVAPNYFDAATGLLQITVDAGVLGFASMSFSINSTEPAVVIRLNLGSVAVLTETVDKIATFDVITERLVLPELVVSGAAAFRNVSFILSDAEQLLFTLESFEQI